VVVEAQKVLRVVKALPTGLDPKCFRVASQDLTWI